MAKKAQFYTFAGILLISMVFMITATRPTMTKKDRVLLQDYLDNYKREARTVIDNSIYGSKNISSELMNYTTEFKAYALSKNLDLDIVSLHSYDGRIFVANKGDETVFAEGVALLPDNENALDYREEVTVAYDDIDYVFAFRIGETAFQALMVENE
jgi:hypothetical protein